jgi:hypothetical protein
MQFFLSYDKRLRVLWGHCSRCDLLDRSDSRFNPGAPSTHAPKHNLFRFPLLLHCLTQLLTRLVMDLHTRENLTLA